MDFAVSLFGEGIGMTGRNYSNFFEGDGEISNVSRKDLNEERLRNLTERLSTSDPKSPSKPFANYTTEPAPEEPAASATPKKFSESWLKMQSFIKQRSADMLRWDRNFR
jgi:hypothetical protein